MAFSFKISVLATCNSQDVGLANAPCRMVGGCLATVQHQEIYYMKASKFYAVLLQKSNLLLWLIFITVLSLGLGTLMFGGEFAMQLNPFKIEVKQQK